MTTHESIALGGGCFWCLDAVFRRLGGVVAVESGYSNGNGSTPTYEDVCSGHTGHVEVVRVRFDPQVLPLARLLDVFFAVHDPTSLNRQGADAGPQYRSGIYWEDAAQLPGIQAALQAAQAVWSRPIVTEVQALAGYVPAEAYHQDYFNRQPHAGYCAVVIAPKLARAQAQFAPLWVGGTDAPA